MARSKPQGCLRTDGKPGVFGKTRRASLSAFIGRTRRIEGRGTQAIRKDSWVVKWVSWSKPECYFRWRRINHDCNFVTVKVLGSNYNIKFTFINTLTRCHSNPVFSCCNTLYLVPSAVFSILKYRDDMMIHLLPISTWGLSSYINNATYILTAVTKYCTRFFSQGHDILHTLLYLHLLSEAYLLGPLNSKNV